MKNSFIALAFSMITQLGLSVITPPILCILAATWLQSKFNLGDWCMITAILLGTASGVLNMINSIRRISAQVSKKPNKREDNDNA